jgi:hypothetical protein
MQTPKFSYKKAGAGAGVVGNAEGRRRAQSGLKLRIKIAYMVIKIAYLIRSGTMLIFTSWITVVMIRT